MGNNVNINTNNKLILLDTADSCTEIKSTVFCWESSRKTLSVAADIRIIFPKFLKSLAGM